MTRIFEQKRTEATEKAKQALAIFSAVRCDGKRGTQAQGELRELAAEQVQALVANWLPGAKGNAKPSADDRRLMAALEWWGAEQEKEAVEVPY